MRVERAIIHDVTQNIPYSNDLALLKLAEEVDLSVHQHQGEIILG